MSDYSEEETESSENESFSIYDSILKGVKFELEPANDVKYESDGDSIDSIGTCAIPSLNTFILGRQYSISIYDTKKLLEEEIRIPNPKAKKLKSRPRNFNLLKLNNEVILLFTHIGDRYKKRISALSIQSLCIKGKRETISSLIIDCSIINPIVLERNTFLLYVNDYKKKRKKGKRKPPTPKAKLQIYHVSPEKIDLQKEFDPTQIGIVLFTQNLLMKCSKKFKSFVYFNYSIEDDIDDGEIISMVNYDDEVLEKKIIYDIEEVEEISDISVTKNKNNEELVIIVGCDTMSFVRLINFSKTPPVEEKTIDRYLNQSFKSIKPIDYFLCCKLIGNDILFIGPEEYGMLIAVDLKNEKKYFNKSVAMSKGNNTVRYIDLLAIEKNKMRLAVTGKDSVSFVKIEGIDVNLGHGNDRFWKRDEEERINFIFEFQDLFFDKILKKRAILEVKLSNIVISNTFKSFLQ